MKNFRLLYVLAPTFLCACGGDGSGPNVARFAGNYTGSFASDATDDDASGTVNVTVAEDGTITGTTTDSRYGNNGVVANVSRVRADGSVTFNATYTSGGSPFTFATASSGTLVRNDPSSLTGMLLEHRGDVNVPFTYTLTKVTP